MLVLKIKRLNDLKLSDWWVLLSCVPILGPLWSFILFCVPGTKNNNNFSSHLTNSPKRQYRLAILTLPPFIFLVYLVTLIKYKNSSQFLLGLFIF
jgi:uncharacterized membrane protein YhaH (DUF805 family)